MSTYNAATATIIKATAPGATGTGPINIPGLEAGDVLMKVIPDGFDSELEEVISVTGELQQFANLDWSTVTFVFYLFRGV